MTTTKNMRRDREGRYIAECQYCACPEGCACSPEEPCTCCGTAKPAKPVKKTAEIHYTVEVRGNAVRRKAEVTAYSDKLGGVVARKIAKLEEHGAYQVETRWEA